jgi:hypothetical protein
MLIDMTQDSLIDVAGGSIGGCFQIPFVPCLANRWRQPLVPPVEPIIEGPIFPIVEDLAACR